MRGAAALLAGMSVVLAGCTSSSTQERAPSETRTSSSGPVEPRDLMRLAEVVDDFPPGYQPRPPAGVGSLDAKQAMDVGDFVSYGESLAVDPQSCLPLLKPVTARAGTHWVTVSSATGPRDPFIALSVYEPVEVSAAIPAEGCDRFDFEVEGAMPDGTAERLAAPAVDGATTYAVKVTSPQNGTAAVELPLVEYFYTAILDDRTYLNLWARVPSEFAAEPALPELLRKGVAALD